MKRYFIDGKEASQEEAEKAIIESGNIFESVMDGKSDFSELQKCKFVIVID